MHNDNAQNVDFVFYRFHLFLYRFMLVFIKAPDRYSSPVSLLSADGQPVERAGQVPGL